jgi:hypothetical protein
MSVTLNIVPESSSATPCCQERQIPPADLAARLQAIVKQVADAAPWQPGMTPDAVGLSVIRSLPEMHPGALATMALVSTILSAASKR